MSTTEEIFKNSTKSFIGNYFTVVSGKTSQYTPMDTWEEHNFINDINESENILTNDDYDLDQIQDEIIDTQLISVKLDKVVNKLRITTINNLISDTKIIFIFKNFNMTTNQKMDILNTQINVSIGGSEITCFTLVENIVLAHLINKNLVDEGDKLIIPLILFNEYAHGRFPAWLLCFHELNINITNYLDPETEVYFEYHQHILSSKFTNNLLPLTVIVPQYYPITASVKNKNYVSIECRFNLLVKCILIRFIPNDLDDNSMSLINPETPIIDRIELIADNKDPLVFTNNELLQVDFMGIKIYVVPLTPELKNWETTSEYLTSSKYSGNGVNFSRIDRVDMDIYLEQEFTGDCVVEAYYHNIQKFMSGMSGLAFSG